MKLVDYYKEKLEIDGIPEFIYKYLGTPSMKRLKGIGYFCGMDYASLDIYNFSEYITRYDHSVTCALLTWKLTKNKLYTIAALYHDVATPCFSHVIDYMNGDYSNQESTEEYTDIILSNDRIFRKCLEEDNLKVEDIINYKDYSIVDNKRPRLCADRLDGVILTGISWTKNVDKKFIDEVVDNLKLFINEDGKEEIGFTDALVGEKVLEVSDSIDVMCHSKEDNYMMELLANIVRLGMGLDLFSYDDLYKITEEELFRILDLSEVKEIEMLLNKFRNIKKEDIEIIELPEIKKRDLNPLVLGKRLKGVK